MHMKPYRRKTHYYETDQMAIIHHANYIHWFEETRVDFMEQVGFGYLKAVESGIDFALLGLECDYKNMVRFGDEVDIYCTIAAVTPSRMTVRYRVVNPASGQLCAMGETRHCYFSSQLQRPVSLKKVLPELYELFCSLAEGAEKDN